MTVKVYLYSEIHCFKLNKLIILNGYSSYINTTRSSRLLEQFVSQLSNKHTLKMQCIILLFTYARELQSQVIQKQLQLHHSPS